MSSAPAPTLSAQALSAQAVPAITLDDIRAAAERLRPHIVRTPLLQAPVLSEELGFRLLVKAEPLQRTGSFKFRGALNKILSLPQAERAAGVVAFSSGNHGHAVAAAARMQGIPAVIVMPADAPQIKVESCRLHGAEVVLYDRATGDREAIAREIIAERGMALVKPFDDPAVMAGQGTIGIEIAEQAAEAGVTPDVALICCSGGGLSSGVATALKALSPGTKSYSVEPAGFDKMRRSLAAGTPQRNERITGSIMDALMSPTAGSLTLPTLLAAGGEGLVATDEAALDAIAAAFHHLKLVLEPGGAAALAAAMSERERFQGQTVVVVASGGNVDREMFGRALARP